MIPRSDYGNRSLDLENLLPKPIEMFESWFQDAVDAGVPEPNAMCLCTVAEDGMPDGRIVLLKGLDSQGLVFYTNYESRKGQQLLQSGKASLVFYWDLLKRQVRFSGKVAKVESETSDTYFQSRPRESKLGAWASLQSRALSSRESLESRLRDYEEKYPEAVPRPPHWGGFRLQPERAEFWQGRTSRLHDRFVYHLQDQGWTTERLMP